MAHATAWHSRGGRSSPKPLWARRGLPYRRGKLGGIPFRHAPPEGGRTEGAPPLQSHPSRCLDRSWCAVVRPDRPNHLGQVRVLQLTHPVSWPRVPGKRGLCPPLLPAWGGCYTGGRWPPLSAPTPYWGLRSPGRRSTGAGYSPRWPLPPPAPRAPTRSQRGSGRPGSRAGILLPSRPWVPT